MTAVDGRADPRRWVASRVYYGWVVAVACFLASLVVFGTTYSFGVFADRLADAMGVGRAAVSAVFGVHTFVIYLGAPFVGGAVDRFGARRTLAVGGVVLAAGLVATSRAGSLAALVVAYGVVAAVGLSVVYVVAYSTVPLWFERRRGAANGIATAGLGAGLLAVAPTASALVTAVGWRTAYVVLAGGLLAVLAVVVALFADDPDDVAADVGREFEGTSPDGISAPWRDRVARVRSVVADPAFALVLLGWTCVYATLYVVFGHLVFYVTDVGMGRWVGAWSIGAIGVVTSGARLGVGALSDRLGRVRTFVACSTGMGLAVVVLPAARTPLAVGAFAVAFGIAYGGNGALLSPLVADLFGETDLATLYGVTSLAFGVAGLVAAPAAGAVYEATGTYAPVFVGVGAVGVLGAGLVRAAGRATDRT